MVVNFTEMLRENLEVRFPKFGTDRELHRFGNYLGEASPLEM